MNTFSIPEIYLKKGVKVPRVLVGSSPFIAAGQFGFKSYDYYHRFVLNPGNIVKILEYCFKKGAIRVQLLTYSFIARAVKEASRRTGVKPIIVATLMPDDENSLDWVLKLDSAITLVHASIVDTHDLEKILNQIDLLKEHGLEYGLVTHEPLRTVPFIKKHRLTEVLMAPVNKQGIFMGDRDKVLALYRDSGLSIVGKKVLGAGRIPVKEALEYVFSLDFVKSVAVGIASIREAEETLSTACSILSNKE
ncbi:MAG TPA: hypothetical protein ENF55_05740 [Thermoprotei archaeon]|nr:hypothetical protein [Thermoprotei archaeon]